MSAQTQDTNIRLDGLVLDIRRAVAFRERTTDEGVLFYLSLFEDEIDDRLERFLASPGIASGTAATVGFAGVEASAPWLELTDAIVLRGRAERIVVVRGGSCTIPLFWRHQMRGVRFSTTLPLLDGAKFSRAGLASALAVVCLPGAYEPNMWVETPLQAWRRLRRGAITTFQPGRTFPEEAVVDRIGPTDAVLNEDKIAERIRTAFADYNRSQRHVTSSVLELSGGFDSTLAGAAARTPYNTMRGVSVEFPYYEFRFERPVQQAVGAALGIPRIVLDGAEMFPYAPWEKPPRFDEPAIFVTGIRHVEKVAGLAAAHNATRIYMGHGGDQLFSTDLTADEPVSRALARAPFSRDTWHVLRQAMAQIQKSLWRRRSTGCFVYDARQDVWVKEAFGASVRTPFSDIALFRVAQMWSRWCASQNARPDKTILSHALGHMLPDAVVQRKGKVAYDGVWMRAYAVHGEHIARTLDRASAVLEHIGVSPAWLLRRVRQLAAWQPVSDREILGAYGLSAWLISWGIERVSDVAWE